MPRKERRGQPKKQASIELERYRAFVYELRYVRRQRPVDEDEEERILDTMDVIWASMTGLDRAIIHRQFERQGK